jgi:ring-1,2-phenylacetyl-CoA epoxidase subunit PaaC
MSVNRQQALVQYILRLGDNALILGHRLSEWTANGPILEEDIALTNIALDLVGQSRMLLSYAGEIEGKGRTEDDLAYYRQSAEFRNALLTETDNGDFAQTIARQLFYSVFADQLLQGLQKSTDATLAGYAAKAIKENAYHLRHASEWTLRLGDGTDESKRRMQEGIDKLWMFTGDLFATTEADTLLVNEGVVPDVATFREAWLKRITAVLTEATLTVPESKWFQSGSREGVHTESLSYLLGEMQSLARAYPGAKW